VQNVQVCDWGSCLTAIKAGCCLHLEGEKLAKGLIEGLRLQLKNFYKLDRCTVISTIIKDSLNESGKGKIKEKGWHGVR